MKYYIIVLMYCYVFMLIIFFLFLFSTSFIFCWMLIECSTLVFLGLICLQNVNQKFMSISSYFLIQVFSSSLFLLSMAFMYDNTFLNLIGLFFYNFALSMKIGLFPFYSWILNLVYNMNWFGVGLLSTFQKFMPMMMLSLNIWCYYILLISILGMLVSMYYSVGLFSVKLIFSYSILSHSSWMSLMLIFMSWWLVYYLLYSLIFLMICLFNYKNNIEELSDLLFLSNSPIYCLMIYLLNIIALTGMPPFSGFLFKMMMINYFSYFFSYFYLLLLVLSSLVHFYVYIRVVLSSLFIYLGKSKVLMTYFYSKLTFNDFMYFISILSNLFILLLGFNILY